MFLSSTVTSIPRIPQLEDNLHGNNGDDPNILKSSGMYMMG